MGRVSTERDHLRGRPLPSGNAGISSVLIGETVGDVAGPDALLDKSPSRIFTGDGFPLVEVVTLTCSTGGSLVLVSPARFFDDDRDVDDADDRDRLVDLLGDAFAAVNLSVRTGILNVSFVGGTVPLAGDFSNSAVGVCSVSCEVATAFVFVLSTWSGEAFFVVSVFFFTAPSDSLSFVAGAALGSGGGGDGIGFLVELVDDGGLFGRAVVVVVPLAGSLCAKAAVAAVAVAAAAGGARSLLVGGPVASECGMLWSVSVTSRPDLGCCTVCSGCTSVMSTRSLSFGCVEQPTQTLPARR